MENSIVTLKELQDIEILISKNTDEHQKYNALIDDEVIKNYDVIAIKKELTKLFNIFKAAKYLYKFPVEENISINNHFNETGIFSKNKTTSYVEDTVAKYIDNQLYTTKLYHSIIDCSSKFTGDEAIYFLNTFINHISEEDIAEIIGISKTYLQKIKKSCIIKIWVDLKQYCKWKKNSNEFFFFYLNNFKNSLDDFVK